MTGETFWPKRENVFNAWHQETRVVHVTGSLCVGGDHVDPIYPIVYVHVRTMVVRQGSGQASSRDGPTTGGRVSNQLFLSLVQDTDLGTVVARLGLAVGAQLAVALGGLAVELGQRLVDISNNNNNNNGVWRQVMRAI